MDDGVGTPSPPFGSFFTPLLISLAGIVSTSFAIVAYHLILARYCLRRRRRNVGSRWPVQGPNAQFLTGVEEKILNAIPILSYSTRNAETFRVDQTECVVCLGELEDDEMVRLLPNCRHAFHVPCIDKWFSAHTSCPICRSPVVAEPETSGIPSSGIEIGEEEESGDGGSCVQSGRLLRHCVSLVLPMEGKRRYLVTGLRRSLSMDQSYVINVQIEREKQATTTSSNWCSKDVVTWSSRSVSSMKQLDRMSSMLLRSFSQLRINSQSSTARGILPY